MAGKDAYVHTVDVLSSFSSSLFSIGTNLSSDANRVASATFSKISDLRDKLTRIEDRYRETQEEYEIALQDLQYANDEYEEYLSYTDPENISPATLDSLRREIDACRSAVNIARSKMQDWAGRYEMGQSTFQRATQSLNTLRQLASSFSTSISADVDRAADNVRAAASILSQYNN